MEHADKNRNCVCSKIDWFIGIIIILTFEVFCWAICLQKEAASAGAKSLCFPEVFSYVGAKDGDSVSIAEPLNGPLMQKYCSLARWYTNVCLFLLTDPISPQTIDSDIFFR